MTNEVLTTVIQILVPILATALGTVLIALANNVSTYFKQRTNSGILQRYISLLNSVVCDVVLSLNQTTVADIKAASADGKLTKEEIDSISVQAIESVKNIIGARGVEVLQLVYEDLDALIANKIERAVGEAKLPPEQEAACSL